MFQIADPRMVQVMILLHHLEGGECKRRQAMARPFILLPRLEQGMVAAIMLQHVKAHSREGKNHPGRYHDVPSVYIDNRQSKRGEIHRKRSEIAERSPLVILKCVLSCIVSEVHSARSPRRLGTNSKQNLTRNIRKQAARAKNKCTHVNASATETGCHVLSSKMLKIGAVTHAP